jgi:DNA-directed RNA polymerase subunit RPC12/RpoP
MSKILAMCSTCFQEYHMNRKDDPIRCGRCHNYLERPYKTRKHFEKLYGKESLSKMIELHERIEHFQTQIVPDLNMQIERGLKEQIRLRKESYDSSRSAKSFKFIAEGFLKDGFNRIEKHVYSQCSSFLGNKSLMDAKGTAVRKSDHKMYLILEENAWNWNPDASNQSDGWFILCNENGWPEIVSEETFKKEFEKHTDLPHTTYGNEEI